MGPEGLRNEKEEMAEYRESWGESFQDNLSGVILSANLVKKARQEEIDSMLDWQVWEEVPVEESWRLTGKGPLGSRWVDVNKGDDAEPNVRSRFVAKEIAYYEDADFFAAMPPLEALRLLISRAATEAKNRKLLVIDARKAHLHAVPTWDIFVELPPKLSRPGFCGRLKRCLYGTRDAPARWEAYLAAELKRHGFLQGVSSACCFRHNDRDLRCVVHGDDFAFARGDEDLDWVQKKMEESFLIKIVGKLGPDADDLKEIRILNRILRWLPEGIQYEADPRHAEILARDWKPGGPAVRTAGAKPSVAELEAQEEEPMTTDEVRLYRSGTARANYLAMDRVDLSFATKELCRRMSAPRRSDMKASTRVVRYLVSEPRVVYCYPWQGVADLKVYVDTDFAGCLLSRKSTSGGCAPGGDNF